VGARVTDSALYGHLWGTDELRSLLDERARIARWIDILAALAVAEAAAGVVPKEASDAIVRNASVDRLDLELVARETRRTGHSTLGLIRGLREILPEQAREWVYYGATVQDVTDTWAGLVMRDVGDIVARDLRDIEADCLALARRHRDAAMAGRTHGQPGAPITFGFKAATWADEVARHRARLREGRARWAVAQLAGSVGSLAFLGGAALAVRARFCAELGLGEPAISWTATRDRIAEFGSILGLVTGTLGRIANEVYELQRAEIAELREAVSPDVVGSITMPHKRNPERSEQVVTLARATRAQTGLLVEQMVGAHERDGRAWKAEWIALPEACLLTGAALRLTKEVLAGIEVDEVRMRANLESGGGWHASEHVLAALAPRLGKHRAQALLQHVFAEARARDAPLRDALLASAELRAELPAAAVEALTSTPDTGVAGDMIDEVVLRAGEGGGGAS
jgi:adenylosuccinate lyase